MKNILILLMLLSVPMLYTGCEKFLEEESKTNVTAKLLFTEPEALDRVLVGIYGIERNLVNLEDGGIPSLLDRGTDIDVFRGGGGATFFRYDNIKVSDGTVESYWRSFYRIIELSNEVVDAAVTMDTANNALVQNILAEAKYFRAHYYFHLIRRYDRLYLNTMGTNISNVKREYAPANPADVYALINSDLDYAIRILPWSVDAKKTGRTTKGAAKHVKAKVALWQQNYDEAIKQVDEIDAQGRYSLMAQPGDVFETGGKNITHNEAIQVIQFSREVGGATVSSTDGALIGHRLSLIMCPNYKKVPGMNYENEQGGYGWGRHYPNSYLRDSMFKGIKTRDLRYSQYMRHTWYYNDSITLPTGKHLGDVMQATDAAYFESGHPACWKYIDKWTKEDAYTSSFKDVIIYRLAETYLIGAQAYFHKYGGAHSKTLYYYNKTWQRAGNPVEGGPVTEQMIMNEHARELFLEGHRWYFLKNLDMIHINAQGNAYSNYHDATPKPGYGDFMVQYITKYGGDAKAVVKSTDALQPRTNFKAYMRSWPVPQSEIDQMGAQNFPQNPGYLN